MLRSRRRGEGTRREPAPTPRRLRFLMICLRLNRFSRRSFGCLASATRRVFWLLFCRVAVDGSESMAAGKRSRRACRSFCFGLARTCVDQFRSQQFLFWVKASCRFSRIRRIRSAACRGTAGSLVAKTMTKNTTTTTKQ